MWVATTRLPKSVGHVFYRKLNRLFADADFDRFVENLCEPYYHDSLGRPSIPPGVYFRMLLVGYFEGIGSQRGIAWRCADSLSLREFLGIPLIKETPDHSSLTRVRDRLPLEVHAAVFQRVLALAAEKKRLLGKTVAVDSTTLEAHAAMKSIVRRDTGEDWNAYLRRLMKEREGVENPTDEELRRFDRNRKDKHVSNEEWTSPCARRSQQATSAVAWRTGGAKFRARLRDGRIASELASRAGESSETIPDVCDGAELGIGDAKGVWNRDRARFAGRGRSFHVCVCCVF
jgi:transposase